MTRIVLSHSHNDHTGGLGGLAPNVPIRTIVGGLHLCHATDGEIERTGNFLKQLDLEQLVLLHCTGEAAGVKLKEMLSCPVVWGSAGSVLIDGTM